MCEVKTHSGDVDLVLVGSGGSWVVSVVASTVVSEIRFTRIDASQSPSRYLFATPADLAEGTLFTQCTALRPTITHCLDEWISHPIQGRMGSVGRTCWGCPTPSQYYITTCCIALLHLVNEALCGLQVRLVRYCASCVKSGQTSLN